MFKSFLITFGVVIGFCTLLYADNSDLSSDGGNKCNIFTFDATGSHDPDAGNITYKWDLGDGTVSNEPVVQHEYLKAGDYTVDLTITDNSGAQCNSATATQKVHVNIPPTVEVISKDFVCSNDPVTFDAETTSGGSKKDFTYQWDFGDGSKSQDKKRATKTYKNGGKYSVSLKVDDKSGSTCSSAQWEKSIYVNEPPKADAGPENILKCITDNSDLLINFDASNTTDANNDNLVYQWDFGDGEQGQGPKVTHQYREVGNYDVKLVVSDNTDYGCSTGVDFVTVRLNQSPVPNAGEDVLSCPNESIDFDASNSTLYKKGTVGATWAFGDGQTSEEMKTTHSYDHPGTYQATLTLKNQLNDMCPPAQDTRNISINAAPSVSLKSPDSVCAGDKVELDASSAIDPDNDALEYYWTFGDGDIIRSDAKVTHQYQQGGSYRASVIVDDGKKTSCSTATAATNIKVNTPPIADAGPNSTCCVGKEAEFNASRSSDPDGDKLTYTWDFGDGTTTEGEVVNHSYSKGGSYNVNLTVDDNSGSSCNKSSAGFVAQVNATPVAVINIR